MSIAPPRIGKAIDTTEPCTSLATLGQKWLVLGVRRPGLGMADDGWDYTFADKVEVFKRMRHDNKIITVQGINPDGGKTTLFGKLVAPVIMGRRGW